jgi:hypothetical protein
VKFWARLMKQERDGFRFKSFMIEMILAKLCDDGLDFSDYPEALQHFFTYIARSDMREKIAFGDYYPSSTVPANADVSSATFGSYMTYTAAWLALTQAQQTAFEATLPFSRSGAPEPSVSGYFTDARKYSSGGTSSGGASHAPCQTPMRWMCHIATASPIWSGER